MTICYFAFFDAAPVPGARIGATDLEHVLALIGATPGLAKALVHTPTDTATPHPFSDDGPAPALALQLYFAAIADLEAVTRADGHLQALARAGALPSLAGAAVTQQAMVARMFPVSDPVFATAPGERPGSYLVHYPGAA